MTTDLEITGILDSTKRINLGSDLRKGLENLSGQLLALSREYKERSEKLKASEIYSPQGRKLKHQEICEKLSAKIKPYFNSYDELIQQKKKKISNTREKPGSDIQELLKYLRQAEIRKVYGLDKSDLNLIDIQANLDKTGFLDALLSAPAPLLAQAELDKLQAEQGEKIDPQGSQELKDLEYVNQTIKGIADSIFQEMQKNGFTPEGSDPITEMIQNSKDLVAELAA